MNMHTSDRILFGILIFFVFTGTASARLGAQVEKQQSGTVLVLNEAAALADAEEKQQSGTVLVLDETAVLADAEEKQHVETPPASIEDLLKPVRAVENVACETPEGILFATTNSTCTLKGELPGEGATVVLRSESGAWDISDFSYFRIDLVNTGPGLVWVQGRLDNPGAKDWANSTPSSAFLMPGEQATLGFAYPRSGEANDAPEIFGKQSGKPNGHRTHWKAFDPKNVVSCRLIIHSSSSELSLDQIQISMAYPYGVEANAERMELPYLDRFGQVRRLEWPGKLDSEKELLSRREKEEEAAELDDGPAGLDQYGGWADGPKLEATGFFRTEKVNGKWWLVNPEGHLFFSHGANDISYRQTTPVKGRRELFAWLPEEEDPLMSRVLKKGTMNFMEANLIRTFGDGWKESADARTHRRLRSWGLNTIGAWSDPKLMEDQKTPYTPIVYTPGVLGDGHHGVADPFSEGFKKSLREGLKKLNPSDPWCVGVFIDNELGWVSPFIHKAFELGAEQPAREVLVQWLQNRYLDVVKLNEAWETSFTAWDQIEELPETKSGTDAFKKDIVSMKVLLAGEYYGVCKEAMREILPNHLYLGSRIHTAPADVLRESAKHVDVMSRNSYSIHPGSGVVEGIDLPAMSTEFHFGAPDRGVPGVGLYPVGNQLQRARTYAAYVMAGLLHPNVIGTHWFAYSDQSAAGRPGENYQIGFVDVTDRPYPLFTKAVREMTDKMYDVHFADDPKLMELLEKLWAGDAEGEEPDPVN